MRVFRKSKGVLDHGNLKGFIRIEGANLHVVDHEIATLTIQIAITMTTIGKDLEIGLITTIETRGAISLEIHIGRGLMIDTIRMKGETEVESLILIIPRITNIRASNFRQIANNLASAITNVM